MRIMIRIACLFISCCFNDPVQAQEKPSVAKKAVTGKGNWVSFYQGDLFGFIYHATGTYAFNSETDGLKELYKLENGKLEVLVSRDVLNRPNSQMRAFFDSKGKIFFYYFMYGNSSGDLIFSWDGKQLIPVGDERRGMMKLSDVYMDPANQMVAVVNSYAGKNNDLVMVYKQNKWESLGLENQNGFENLKGGLYSKSDFAGNLYFLSESAIVKWDGKSWEKINRTELPGRINYSFFSSANVLHVSLMPEPGMANGKVYKYEQGKWYELSLGLDFFDKLNVSNIYVRLFGKNNYYVSTKLKGQSGQPDQIKVYKWTGTLWSDITGEHISANNESIITTHPVFDKLYMIDHSMNMAAVWNENGSPAVKNPVKKGIVSATQPMASASEKNKAGSKKPVTTKQEPAVVAKEKLPELFAEQVDDYTIVQVGDKFGVKGGMMRAVTYMEPVYLSIKPVRMNDRKSPLVFVAVGDKGIEVFNPATLSYYRSPEKLVEFWHEKEWLWLKTDKGRWNVYPENITSTSGFINLTYVKGNFVYYSSADRFNTMLWEKYPGRTGNMYQITPGTEILDVSERAGTYTYKLNGKIGYYDSEGYLNLPPFLDDLAFWSSGTKIHIVMTYKGVKYNTTTEDIRRIPYSTELLIKAYTYSMTCGNRDCRNGVIGSTTSFKGGEVKKRQYEKLTINGRLLVTETYVTPVEKTVTPILCQDRAHEYKRYLIRVNDNAYSVESR